MLLTSKEIIEKGIVIPSQYSKPTQVGIDLSVCKVERILGGSVVYKDKTIVDPLNFMEVETLKIDGKECWRLDKGSYAITFNEGCKIPANATDLFFIDPLYTGQELQLFLLFGIQDTKQKRWVRL
jgi:hypothetical protein